MTKVAILNQTGDVVGDLELAEGLFDVEVNDHAIYTVVKNIRANKRQGTQSARTRGEVRGGGRKPYRQKGTGRARQGSRVAPQWRGGGVIFAVKPRDYSYTTPKKIRRLAFKSVLTQKARNEELIVLDKLGLERCSTKDAVQVLHAIKAQPKAMVVVKDAEKEVVRSFRNLPGVRTIPVNELNVYDLLQYDSLIMTQEAVKELEEVFQ